MKLHCFEHLKIKISDLFRISYFVLRVCSLSGLSLQKFLQDFLMPGQGNVKDDVNRMILNNSQFNSSHIFPPEHRWSLLGE